jgi:hypothetical protein
MGNGDFQQIRFQWNVCYFRIAFLGYTFKELNLIEMNLKKYRHVNFHPHASRTIVIRFS